MGHAEWKPPKEFVCIYGAGVTFWVSKEVAREIEAWHKGLEFPKDQYAFLTVEDIVGSELTIYAGTVCFQWTSSEEDRVKSEVMTRFLRQEKKENLGPEIES